MSYVNRGQERRLLHSLLIKHSGSHPAANCQTGWETQTLDRANAENQQDGEGTFQDLYGSVFGSSLACLEPELELFEVWDINVRQIIIIPYGFNLKQLLLLKSLCVTKP